MVDRNRAPKQLSYYQTTASGLCGSLCFAFYKLSSSAELSFIMTTLHLSVVHFARGEFDATTLVHSCSYNFSSKTFITGNVHDIVGVKLSNKSNLGTMNYGYCEVQHVMVMRVKRE